MCPGSSNVLVYCGTCGRSASWLALKPFCILHVTVIVHRVHVVCWKTTKSWKVSDAEQYLGKVMWSPTAQFNPTCTPPDNDELPLAFDCRRKWSECYKNYQAPFSGPCSSSWAIATASSLSDRLCFAAPSKYTGLQLSAQELLSCDRKSHGCAGGFVDQAIRYATDKGLVEEKCFPYEGKPVPCSKKCESGAAHKVQSTCKLPSDDAIMREVRANGPVVTLISVYDDLLVYSSGVYKPNNSAKRLLDKSNQYLLHAVKIIGWGIDDSTYYWLIEPSFGSSWGINGYARIAIKSTVLLTSQLTIAMKPESKQENAKMPSFCQRHA
eukprot:GHVT01085147.1.p1 GENE.GHVT01085147.1~~GHVT01085147.1.p1  ORF type:complete len:324 (-),score=29.28 GHVT01085147.1:1284-2255(-)